MSKILKSSYFFPLLFLSFIVLVVTYLNRWIFFYKFDPVYWENYYYESQWNVPNSSRVIPDEGVYRYIGYRLVNGENPFNIDYWVPPLGKYWYGWGAKYLSNPYLVSYFYYLSSLLVFWFIVSCIFKEKRLQYLSLLIFSINPLLVEQIGQTMLDLPLTLFLMLTIYFLLLAAAKKKLVYVVLAGISLGLMSGTKPQYFIPMFTLISLLWLYLNKVKTWWFFAPSILAGYLLSYTCYFIAHPNPIPFIRLHQKIIDFQKNNAGSHDPLNIFKVIFLNSYTGHWVGAKTIHPLNWSVILPLGVISMILSLSEFKKTIKNNSAIALLASMSAGYIFLNLFIDFWPRYFMPLIPLLTILTVYIFRRRQELLVLIFIGLIPSLYLLLFPSSTSILSDFNSKSSAGQYKETYRMLSKDTQKSISESEWQLKSLSLNTNNIYPLKEQNQWKISVK